VEITGRRRKMVINALNSGARSSWPTLKTRRADLELMVDGQINCRPS
jgi:hypothetical protein